PRRREEVAAVDLAVLRDGERGLRLILRALRADDRDGRLALGGEAGAGEPDALVLVRDVRLRDLIGLEDRLGSAGLGGLGRGGRGELGCISGLGRAGRAIGALRGVDGRGTGLGEVGGQLDRIGALRRGRGSSGSKSGNGDQAGHRDGYCGGKNKTLGSLHSDAFRSVWHTTAQSADPPGTLWLKGEGTNVRGRTRCNCIASWAPDRGNVCHFCERAGDDRVHADRFRAVLWRGEPPLRS